MLKIADSYQIMAGSPVMDPICDSPDGTLQQGAYRYFEQSYRSLCIVLEL
jgi:hypothetical protein